MDAVKQRICPVKPGDVLAGKYRVERVLGAGGMGVVVAARHMQLDELVALKFLLADALEKADTVARFLREARAAVRIKGEHVARVSDVGTLESGAPYIVMEYLEGEDLGVRLDAEGPISPALATTYVLEACEAIAEAHALGIVHRDLKPSNLFLTRRVDGSTSIKVLDFGIAKAATSDADGEALTATNTTMGSPRYMSPEQIRSARRVDARSDIWSLGIILHELVAGSPPFAGESLPGLLASLVMDEPRRLRDVRPDAPAALEEVILRCLQKEPGQRFADVGELARALAPIAPDARGSVERISRIIGSRPAGSTSTDEPAPVLRRIVPRPSPSGPHDDPTVREATVPPQVTLSTRPPQGNRWVWPGVAALAVLGTGSALIALSRGEAPVGDRPAPTTAQAPATAASAAATAQPPVPSSDPAPPSITPAVSASASPVTTVPPAPRPVRPVAPVAPIDRKGSDRH